MFFTFTQEADLAIAPLMVTPEREKAVNFSVPFTSYDRFGLSIMIGKRNASTIPYSWVHNELSMILLPLATHIWIGIICTYGAVSDVRTSSMNH
jgi:hypothetical protein